MVSRTDEAQKRIESRTVELRYRQSDGTFTETTLDRLPVDEVAEGLPVRDFRSYKGRRHYSGWYYATTGERLVAYESRLELARILLADFDPDVVAMAAQPFQVCAPDGDRMRRHVPDLLLVHADAGVSVVDVKAPTRLQDSRTQEQFSWMRRVCSGPGWAFEAWSRADPVLLDNVRFLAGYRRRQVIDPQALEKVAEAATEHRTIGAIEWALTGNHPAEVVRPAVLHLVWWGHLRAELTCPLSTQTAVVPRGQAR